MRRHPTAQFYGMLVPGRAAARNKSRNLPLLVYTWDSIYYVVKLIQVYKCLCDVQRLRILNLLREGPLCVCHLVELLAASQGKISKQLRYMKELGMVEVEREAQWMIYRLPAKPHALLTENLKCLQDCGGECPEFREDLRRRKRVIAGLRKTSPPCPGAVTEPKAKQCC